MINKEILGEALIKYKEDFHKRWAGENYKWEALKCFHDNWNIEAEDFSAMFYKATEKTANLLASQSYFPRRMIREYAKQEPETIRGMFINLFDESKDLVERILKFQADSQDICNRLTPGLNHYQVPRAITVYLWLMFPEKHDVLKLSVAKGVAKYLESDLVFKKGYTKENIVNNEKLISEIREAVQSDDELIGIVDELCIDKFYKEKTYRTTAFDVAFYITYYLLESKGKTEWSDEEFDSGITKEKWLELFKNEEVFNKQSLEIIARMYDFGGQATCTQLSQKYGETANFYNMGSTALARRIAEKTGCDVVTWSDGRTYYPAILYMGRYAKDEEGTYVWKLREELYEAIKERGIDDILMYAKPNDDNKQYWWLNANPKIWSFSDLEVGEVQNYTLFNENGHKRKIHQNFLDAKTGDVVIGYESTPVKQIVALCAVSQDNDGESIYFEKTEGLTSPIDYQVLKEFHELDDMEFFCSPQGSLFKMTQEEYDFVMDLIRESNPVPQQKEEYEVYTKQEFLSEVYMEEGEYDILKALLLKKQNLILQGAPGVGKTFAAKRLAYSIMGHKDDNRIEFIQFHQSYSYEDFIMGYKPNRDGFELQNGIFYKFCQKAANTPDEPFFFIIDEINRGNMSKIFGELLMLIEKEYRGTKMTLAYNGLPFSVPKNVYIIGMMNTADRSLAMIDYALRRRFSFYSMEPGFESDGFVKYMKSFNNDTFVDLIERVKGLNAEITKDPSLGKGFCIGHSYFCGQNECSDEWLHSVVDYDIVPMLEEYWFDDVSKVSKWKNILLGVFED